MNMFFEKAYKQESLPVDIDIPTWCTDRQTKTTGNIAFPFHVPDLWKPNIVSVYKESIAGRNIMPQNLSGDSLGNKNESTVKLALYHQQ